jgi:hypothetical protein
VRNFPAFQALNEEGLDEESPMDDQTIHRLDEHARTLAEKLGVHARVRFQARGGSQIEPTGPKLVLTVYHGHGANNKRTIDFRPDQPNLMARIEQQIPMLAQELGKH